MLPEVFICQHISEVYFEIKRGNNIVFQFLIATFAK